MLQERVIMDKESKRIKKYIKDLTEAVKTEDVKVFKAFCIDHVEDLGKNFVNHFLSVDEETQLLTMYNIILRLDISPDYKERALKYIETCRKENKA